MAACRSAVQSALSRQRTSRPTPALGNTAARKRSAGMAMVITAESWGRQGAVLLLTLNWRGGSSRGGRTPAQQRAAAGEESMAITM